MRLPLRVGAIIIQNGKVLTTKMKKKENEYYVLPGGGVEENESIEEALKRELKEELNIEAIKFRLAYIRELNLKDGVRGIEFYYYVESFNGVPSKGFDPENKESSLESIENIDLNNLASVTFYPEQLRGILSADFESNFEIVKHLGVINYT